MSHDIATILAKPSDFGFEFILVTVHSGALAFEGVPIVKVKDIALFDSKFPGVIRDALDGQSIRVGSQRVVREARLRNATVKAPELQRKLVEWLLGIRTTTRAVVYGGPEGTTWPTEEAAAAAWIAYAQKQSKK